jgi:hypothetical protein
MINKKVLLRIILRMDSKEVNGSLIHQLNVFLLLIRSNGQWESLMPSSKL